MVSAMNNARTKIAAAVTVAALGLLAVAALASGGSGAQQPQSAPKVAAAQVTAEPEIRTEVIRQTVHRRAHRSRDDRRPGPRRRTTAAPVSTPAVVTTSRTSGRDASGHGGRGRDHAEDDGTVEVEHHETRSRTTAAPRRRGEDDGGTAATAAGPWRRRRLTVASRRRSARRRVAGRLLRLLAFLAVQVRAGGDPALGAAEAAGARPPSRRG
jgi:hypothetical protein